MKMKRLVTTFGANFEQFVQKMEDHEAVASSVIADVKKAAAQTRIERQAAQNRLLQLTREEEEKNSKMNLWRERARQCIHQGQEERARACLQQIESNQDALTRLMQIKQQQAGVVERLDQQCQKIEMHLRELEARRSVLVSRSAQTRVADVLTETASDSTVFDRWEREVMVKEYTLPAMEEDTEDALNREFEQEESRARLDRALMDLKAEVRKGEGEHES